MSTILSPFFNPSFSRTAADNIQPTPVANGQQISFLCIRVGHKRIVALKPERPTLQLYLPPHVLLDGAVIDDAGHGHVFEGETLARK